MISGDFVDRCFPFRTESRMEGVAGASNAGAAQVARGEGPPISGLQLDQSGMRRYGRMRQRRGTAGRRCGSPPTHSGPGASVPRPAEGPRARTVAGWRCARLTCRGGLGRGLRVPGVDPRLIETLVAGFRGCPRRALIGPWRADVECVAPLLAATGPVRAGRARVARRRSSSAAGRREWPHRWRRVARERRFSLPPRPAGS